jgi:hypothetical protein
LRLILKTFRRASVNQRIESRLATSNNSRFEEIAMAKHKKAGVEPKAGLTGMGEEAETKAIQNWLRGMDKPLAKEKPDREDAEPRGR